MERLDSRFNQKWHEAINRRHWPDGFDGKHLEHARFMYQAKDLADEVPRMVLLFGKERRGELPKIHRQCSLTEPEQVIDNHLRCCLGTNARSCEYLLALEKAELTPEQVDTAKAWTCAAHIMSEGGDVAMEGFLLTTDDRMYWNSVYESMAAWDDTSDQPDTAQTTAERTESSR